MNFANTYNNQTHMSIGTTLEITLLVNDKNVKLSTVKLFDYSHSPEETSGGKTASRHHDQLQGYVYVVRHTFPNTGSDNFMVASNCPLLELVKMAAETIDSVFPDAFPAGYFDIDIDVPVAPVVNVTQAATVIVEAPKAVKPVKAPKAEKSAPKQLLDEAEAVELPQDVDAEASPEVKAVYTATP